MSLEVLASEDSAGTGPAGVGAANFSAQTPFSQSGHFRLLPLAPGDMIPIRVVAWAEGCPSSNYI